MNRRERRIAENESLIRDLNEQILRTARRGGVDAERVPFLCECADELCELSVRLTLDEYVSVRSDEAQFVVAPGHDLPDVEQVLGGNDRYEVVVKQGDAGELARQLDQS